VTTPWLRSVILVLALALLGACVAETVARTPPPPPAPVAEVVPAQPDPAYAWVPGSWAWRPRVNAYVWVPGRWETPASPGSVWVPGHWALREGSYVWVEGSWGSR
jgi:YXWGXW repeat-containing protein